MQYGFSIIDFIILGIYFVLLFWIGFSNSQTQKGIVQYFLAGRNSGWFVIGTSLFITTVSSEHVIGYPESGYAEGFAAGIFAWGACLTILLLAWFFTPFFVRNQVFTTPEFIEKRFGENSRWVMSIFSIVIYVITKVSIILFTGSIFLEALIGWDKYTSSLILVIITGIFSVASGFKGELHTHVFHAYITIGCCFIVIVVGIYQIGGMDEFAIIPAEHFKIFKPSNHHSYPWTGIVFGATILNIWYWCTDQYMIQRILSAENIPNARRGAIFSGYLMLLVPFLLLIPGFIVYIKFGPDAMVGRTYFSLVSEVLPTGVKALAIVGLLSALISSLSASFNSTATLFTLDIYKKIYPDAQEFKIVTVGRLSNLIIVIIAIVWISFISYFSKDIIKHLQTIQSYIAPPFTAVFLVGLLWTRANGKAAVTVLITGGIIGLSRIVLDIFEEKYDQGSLIYTLLEINFLHQAIFLFLFYVLIMIVVSLCTQKPDISNLKGVTYKYRNDIDYIDNMPIEKAMRWKKQDIYSSIILVILLFSIWAFLMF